MKTVIFSLLAVCFAVGLFAFAKPDKEVEKKAVARFEKRTEIEKLAKQPGRYRFCFILSCASLTGNRPAVMNPANYSTSGSACLNEGQYECFGSVCPCAIYAFPNTSTGLPIISSASDPALFNMLNDYVQDGIWNNSHGWVELKDQ